jgi:hypothetical protein
MNNKKSCGLRRRREHVAMTTKKKREKGASVGHVQRPRFPFAIGNRTLCMIRARTG